MVMFVSLALFVPIAVAMALEKRDLCPNAVAQCCKVVTAVCVYATIAS